VAEEGALVSVTTPTTAVEDGRSACSRPCRSCDRRALDCMVCKKPPNRSGGIVQNTSIIGCWSQDQTTAERTLC